MESIILKAPGISCSHCEAAIKKAVGELGGAGKVDVDLEAKLITVEYNGDDVTPDAIRAAIEAQGYETLSP